MAVVHVSAFRLVPLGFRNGIRSLLIINLSIEHLRRDDVTVDLPYAAGPEDSFRSDSSGGGACDLGMAFLPRSPGLEGDPSTATA